MLIEIPDELAPVAVILLEKLSRQMNNSGRCEDRAYDATPENLALCQQIDAFGLGVPVEGLENHPDYTAPHVTGGRFLMCDKLVLNYLLSLLKPQTPKRDLVAV